VAVENMTVEERSANARAWLASLLLLVSVVSLIVNVFVAALPALGGLLISAFGIRKSDPYRLLNRSIMVISIVLIATSIVVLLLVLPTSTVSHVMSVHAG
jgi:hypothetical protein